jgi:dTDP-4-amino-4,6-dideoxygalactose transaminase
MSTLSPSPVSPASPASPATIPLCEPYLRGNERRYIDDCLTTNFVSSVGVYVERFEREFAAYTGSPYAVACVNGTAAIHLALYVSGVGAGDTVLVSDFTFIATANPVRYLGAVPVFVDSEAGSWNLDPQRTVEALADLAGKNQLPKAVLAVHILGQPADLGPIVEACAHYSIPLIEDAAEALGARYDADYPHPQVAGRHVGTVGRIGIFSFNGNKLITTGGGGMLTTADAGLAKRLKHLSTQAKLPGLAFVHDEVGFNYRLTNLAAAMGVAQLEQIAHFLARKQHIADRYARLCAAKGWTYHPVLPRTTPSRWLTSCLVGPRRDELLQRLTAAGIGARPLWLPLSSQGPFRDFPRYATGVAARLAAEGLSLPCSVSLSDEQLDRVCAVLESA